MRFKNRKVAQFPHCQRIIAIPSRSVYTPYHGQLLNGSNSKYDRQSYAPTCTSQQNLLRCNEQPQLIQHEQYSRAFDHTVEAQSVPALQNQPPYNYLHNHRYNHLCNMHLHNHLHNHLHSHLHSTSTISHTTSPTSSCTAITTTSSTNSSTTRSTTSATTSSTTSSATSSATICSTYSESTMYSTNPAFTGSIASFCSTPDHHVSHYQPSLAPYTQYEPVQALSNQSTPQNEHYQDVGLHTEFEQYQNGHLQNEQYPDIRDGFYNSPGDYHMSHCACSPPIHQPWDGREQCNEPDHSYGQYQDNIPPLHRNEQYMFSTFITCNLICVQLNSICVFCIYM